METQKDGMAMASKVQGGARKGSRLRLVIWGIAALLLLLPAIAMQFTSEVTWDETDFIVMGAMLGTACGCYELIVRISDNRIFRAGFGLAILTSFLLVWVNLAVGFIGNEDNQANLMFGGVLAIVVLGSIAARGRARGMALVTPLAAAAHVLILGIALAGNLGAGAPNWPRDVIGGTGMFVALWLAAAGLFHWAARSQAGHES